jgi:hypothetical protein
MSGRGGGDDRNRHQQRQQLQGKVPATGEREGGAAEGVGDGGGESREGSCGKVGQG